MKTKQFFFNITSTSNTSFCLFLLLPSLVLVVLQLLLSLSLPLILSISLLLILSAYLHSRELLKTSGRCHFHSFHGLLHDSGTEALDSINIARPRRATLLSFTICVFHNFSSGIIWVWSTLSFCHNFSCQNFSLSQFEFCHFRLVTIWVSTILVVTIWVL